LTAIGVSQVFNVVVSGTGDCTLIFCSTVTHALVRVVSLGDGIVARKIAITPVWGFVVVYGTEMVAGTIKHYILVFTINGIFVVKTEIGFKIHVWVTWASFRGFDYIAYANEAGQVFFNEVFYLSADTPMIDHLHQAPIAMHFAREASTLVVVTRDGQAVFLPILLF
jgi:hypothetical protein